MEFVAQARVELMPLIDRVLELAGGPTPVSVPEKGERWASESEGISLAFSEASDLPLRAFFTGIRLQARAMQAEDDVLGLFFELSTTAFLGFQYTSELTEAIDNLLAVAERIAFTMTAPVEHPH